MQAKSASSLTRPKPTTLAQKNVHEKDIEALSKIYPDSILTLKVIQVFDKNRFTIILYKFNS